MELGFLQGGVGFRGSQVSSPTSQLGSIGLSTRRFSGRCAGDHNAQRCQDERKWAEDEVLQPLCEAKLGTAPIAITTAKNQVANPTRVAFALAR